MEAYKSIAVFLDSIQEKGPVEQYVGTLARSCAAQLVGLLHIPGVEKTPADAFAYGKRAMHEVVKAHSILTSGTMEHAKQRLARISDAYGINVEIRSMRDIDSIMDVIRQTWHTDLVVFGYPEAADLPSTWRPTT